MHIDPTPHLFWITSRAAGFVALILASLAVSLGLLMSTKLLKRNGPDLIAIHEILALSTIVAIFVHGAALLGDQYLHPSIVDIAIPFVSSYKTAWTTIGIVGGWGLILLGLSYYARGRIGAARWRKLHRFTALAWLAGLVHALGEGTDAGQVWFLAMIAIVAAPAIALLVRRLVGPGRRRGRGQARVGAGGGPGRGAGAGTGPARLGAGPAVVAAAPDAPTPSRPDIRNIPARPVPTRGVPVRS